MNKMLQNFGSIICNILFVIWQDFVMCGRIHRAQSVTPLWFAYSIGVVEQCCHMVSYNTIFTCMCALASEGLFPGGELVDFCKVFLGGAKSGEICFLPLETKKTAVFA